MTTIYDTKNNRYIAQLTIEGKRKSFSGKSKIEAEIKANAFLNSSSRESQILTLTLETYTLEWFKLYKVNDYKKGTYEKEYRRLQGILKDIGSIKLYELETVHIQQYINKLAETISPKTIRNKIILINGALKQAVREGYIRYNPCEFVTLPKVQKAEMVAFTGAERNTFLEVNKDNPYIDIFKFALQTGMRISEICGLQKSDIDYDRKLITINKQLVRLKGAVILDTPKTNQSVRKVPLTKEAERIARRFDQESPFNFLFYNPVSKLQLMQNTLSFNCHHCMQKTYEATKKEVYLKANFHSFRHTFATSWVTQGGNVNLLSKCLGHTDPAFTQRVYVQPSYDDVANEMSKLQF